MQRRAYSVLTVADRLANLASFAKETGVVLGGIVVGQARGVTGVCPVEYVQQNVGEGVKMLAGFGQNNSNGHHEVMAELAALKREHIELLGVIKAQNEALLAMQHQQQQQNLITVTEPPPNQSLVPTSTKVAHITTATHVPATPLRRALNMSGLAIRLAADAGKRKIIGKRDGSPGVLSHKALDMLVDRLCHMRGAALKLGQLLSIQDKGVIPPHVLEAFSRVRNRTNAMPLDDFEKMMSSELGSEWRGKFASFDETPIAAASLGQVHQAHLTSGHTVAVKVQYEGVMESVGSDMSNLRWLFSFGILPKGLYVDNILKELQKELLRECDYIGEAARQEQYRAHLEADPDRWGGLRLVSVPKVINKLSTKKVLVTEWVGGAAADTLFEEGYRGGLGGEKRDEVSEAFLRLTLKELFKWRMMQTDPSFANFMYDEVEHKMHLVDFGAAREFPKDFIEQYLLVVYGATVKDRDMVIKYSQKLGFLTGEECPEMLDAHVNAAFVASLPFSHRGVSDFSKFDISTQMKPHVETMLRLRLTAPPLEIYSLHRRLNGCFQLMTNLTANVDCRKVFIEVLREVHPTLADETRALITNLNY